MEKVHRHKHRRSNSRRNNEDTSTERQNNDNNQQQHHHSITIARINERNNTTNNIITTQNQSSISLSSSSNPAVLVNGHPTNEIDINAADNNSSAGRGSSNHASDTSTNNDGITSAIAAAVALNDSGNTGSAAGAGGGGGDDNNVGCDSSIRKNDTTIGTRRPLQLTPHGSPRPVGNKDDKQQVHRGIMGFMDRELKTTTTSASGGGIIVSAGVGGGGNKKTQSLSDPQASPAQRSTRSRSSLEKSPRRKRSKSESRRRRERKLIAAGEMEVRQANETLMRYLKQVSDMHDASLSGELEIDHNFDERRVHRKTKSQRDKRGHLISRTSAGKLYATGGGLSSILKDLSEDILPAGGEIYNPFTPVVSPTEGPPSRIDKMFIQTSSGYRAVDHCYYKNPIGSDTESNKQEINSSVNLSCALQRIWIMISNICHGLLGGLALAHLLFIATSRPFDWANGAIQHYSSFAEIYANTFYCLAIICMVSVFDRMDICHIDFSNASEFISFRWIIIAMIYIATIILTLCAETMDEKLYLANFNLTMIEGEMENNKVLNIWNSLSIARSIGAIVGWIMIGFSPDEDLLYGNLLEMEKYQLTNN